MSGFRKVDTIDFFLLTNQVNDILIRSGPVPSDTSICVLPGLNGRIDNQKHYKDQKDSILTLNNKPHVVAGSDKICNSKLYYILPTEAKAPNYNELISQCNQVYGKIGLTFAVGKKDTLKMFWESIRDGKLDGNELETINNLLFKSSNNSITRTKVLIAKDLNGQKITSPPEGFALLGLNTLALKQSSSGSTLAHEIGHAKFGLRHPDDDKEHLNSDEDTKPTINFSLRPPFTFGDSNNFMYSIGGSSRNDNIRAYQWKKIVFGSF
jgi:hypothetical protein